MAAVRQPKRVSTLCPAGTAAVSDYSDPDGWAGCIDSQLAVSGPCNLALGARATLGGLAAANVNIFIFLTLALKGNTFNPVRGVCKSLHVHGIEVDSARRILGPESSTV